MKLVTNLSRRYRWEDPLTGTCIPPKRGCPVEVADEVAAGKYFKMAIAKRQLEVQDPLSKKTTIKKKTDKKSEKTAETKED